MNKNKNYDIFGGSKFIESLRSGGYRDTSYAVAEIVDNAIDAGAKHVEILCQNVVNLGTGRYTLDQIAILDDGDGMNNDKLRNSLLFGDGTRGENQEDIGKFGMGLPNSSLSQCKRVDVYSWQNFSEPICCHIDVDEIKQGNKEVPVPERKEIPSIWKKATKNFSKKSGTLVIWNKLDRCSWTTSKKIMEHSQFLIGRIYRRFLYKNTLTITMTTFNVNDNCDIIDKNSKPMLANDPLYLMAPSSTPDKWGKTAMFTPDTIPEEKYQINYDGKEHEIIVHYSIEKNELRAPENVDRDQGGTLHGKHARKNQGISIMRANREITLDNSLGTTSDPRDRWFGIEIDIPQSLDLVIGLTNNKQQADHLTAIMRTINLYQDNDSDQNELESNMSEQDEARSQLFRMTKEIFSHMRSIQRRIRAARAGTRGGSQTSSLNAKIDGGIQHDQTDGNTSQSDKDRKSLNKDQRIELITNALVSEGRDVSGSKKDATLWVNEDRKIIFETQELEGSNFFSAQNIGGILRIKINSNHRAYKNLLFLTDSVAHKDLTCSQRLDLIKDGLWLLIASWARFEDLILAKEKKRIIQDIRHDWGKELNIFLEQNEK